MKRRLSEKWKKFLQKGKLYPVSPPDFFIVGTQKGGTTALFRMLKEHPSVVMPIRKELHFFDRKRSLDASDFLTYERKFVPDWAKRGRLTCDITPSYMYRPYAAVRMKQYAPESKIIFLLRDPVSRAISQYHMKRYALKTEHRSIYKCLSDFDSEYVTRGYYAEQIERFVNFFDWNQILILDSHILKQKGAACVELEKMESFLGLENICSSWQLAHETTKSRSAVEKELNVITDMLREHYIPYNIKLRAMLGEQGIKMSWL